MPKYAKGDLLAAVAALTPALRAASQESEARRGLSEPLVQALVEGGLYGMLLPRSLGGGEVDPLTYFEIIEALAEVESAAAWSVMISSAVMTTSVRWLPDETLAAMFKSPRDTVMAGSAPPRGRLVPAPGGYLLTGRWAQGSNIAAARWVQAGCLVADSGQTQSGPAAKPPPVMCVFPAGAAAIIDTWHTTGMRGTGSHDFAVKDLFVPVEHVQVAPGGWLRSGPLYRVEGWSQVAGWSQLAHAAIGLGIARDALEEFIKLAGSKQPTCQPMPGALATKGTVQAKVAQAEALVGSGRAYVIEASRDMWETALRPALPSAQQRAVYRLAIAQAMTNAVQAVDLLYSIAGVSAIYQESRLDRALRDAHTAAAHVWVAPDTYELSGRLLLGLDPGSPNI